MKGEEPASKPARTVRNCLRKKTIARETLKTMHGKSSEYKNLKGRNRVIP